MADIAQSLKLFREGVGESRYLALSLDCPDLANRVFSGVAKGERDARVISGSSGDTLILRRARQVFSDSLSISTVVEYAWAIKVLEAAGRAPLNAEARAVYNSIRRY